MQTDSLHFAQPLWILVGAIVCAAFIALFIRFDRRRDLDLAQWVHPRFRKRLTEGFSPKLRNLKRALWLLAILMIFLAIARPQMGYEWREVKRKGIDILFAVDTSRSMLAEDLSPNRLERARLGIIDFVSRLEGDRVGLIPFAGSAFSLCPLTLDYEAFRESLDALDTDLIPRQGTDLASAIKEAERLFDENANNFKILVLLTDGEDLEGSVIDAAKEAHKNGMSIYTVGVGSPEGASIPVRLRNGRMDSVRDEGGAVVKTALDESTLKKIAEVTKALYVPLGRGAEGLNTLYQERLRLVPKSELNQRLERIPLERFEWPLGLAFVLLIFEFFITDRQRSRASRPLISAVRKVKAGSQALGFWLLAALLLTIPHGLAAETISTAKDPRQIYNQGTVAYGQGDFTKATESLRTALRTQDLALQQRSYYNLGNSLYRTGQSTLEKDPKATIKTWEESVKAYQDSLSLNPKDKDAEYNMALVSKKLEELKKEQDQQDPKDDKDQKDDKEKKDDQENKDDKEKKDSKDGEDPKDKKDSEQEKKSEEQKKSAEEKEAKDGKPKDGKEEKNSKEAKDKQEGKEGEKPEAAEEGEEKDGEKEEGSISNERPVKDQMTPEEARQMLETLRSDERVVIPLPQRPNNTREDNTTKGKTW